MDLFRDWLSQTGRARVRQSGYNTAAGSVFELFGDASLLGDGLKQGFADFEAFFEACVRDPKAAQASLVAAGMTEAKAAEALARYARDARRLHRDLTQERERRVLTLRHQLELELDDASEAQACAPNYIEAAVNALVPPVGVQLGAPSVRDPGNDSRPLISINQQIVNAASGTILQNIQGATNVPSNASELLRLIADYGNANRIVLESAVYELEDPDSKPEHRLSAKQKLKAFLRNISPKIEEVSLNVAQKYLESKVGL